MSCVRLSPPDDILVGCLCGWPESEGLNLCVVANAYALKCARTWPKSVRACSNVCQGCCTVSAICDALEKQIKCPTKILFFGGPCFDFTSRWVTLGACCAGDPDVAGFTFHLHRN